MMWTVALAAIALLVRPASPLLHRPYAPSSCTARAARVPALAAARRPSSSVTPPSPVALAALPPSDRRHARARQGGGVRNVVRGRWGRWSRRLAGGAGRAVADDASDGGAEAPEVSAASASSSPPRQHRVAVILSRNARQITPSIVATVREVVGEEHTFATGSLAEAAEACGVIAERGYDTVVCCGGDGACVRGIDGRVLAWGQRAHGAAARALCRHRRARRSCVFVRVCSCVWFSIGRRGVTDSDSPRERDREESL